jgi:hypothetical protein
MKLREKLIRRKKRRIRLYYKLSISPPPKQEKIKIQKKTKKQKGIIKGKHIMNRKKIIKIKIKKKYLNSCRHKLYNGKLF